MRKIFLLLILCSVSIYGQEIPLTDYPIVGDSSIEKRVENNLEDALEAHAMVVYSQRVLFGTGAPTNPCPTGKIYLRTSNGFIYGCAAGTWFLSASGGGATANSTTGNIPYLSAANVYSDSPLSRVDANTIEQRNSTNAQTFRVYNTYTDASNYERADLFWTGNIFRLTVTGAGTGSARALFIDAATMSFRSNAGATRWTIDSSGHLVTGADNTYDIGASGATRPRTIYAGTDINSAGRVLVGTNLVFTGKSIIQSNTDGNLTVLNNAGSKSAIISVNTPTAASTGTGTGPTNTVDTGDSDFSGTITVTAGTTPGNTGTITVTFSAAYGTNAPVCTAMLGNGTGSWNGRATVIGGTFSTTSAVFNWDNNAVNLTAASTYKLHYRCTGK